MGGEALTCGRSEMVDFGSEQGWRIFETGGIAMCYFEDFEKREYAALVRAFRLEP